MADVNQNVSPFLRKAAIGHESDWTYLTGTFGNAKGYLGEGAAVSEGGAWARESKPTLSLRLGARPRARWSETQEIGARCTEPGFRGRELELEIVCLRSRLKRARMVLTWADGSKSNTITSPRYAETCSKPLVTSFTTLTKPTRRCASALRYNQQLVSKTRWSAKQPCVEPRICARGCLTERRHEAEEGETPPSPK